MDAKKVDRRIERTRQLLRDALLALVVERDYESISIQDIADRANVNRTTFYLHFRDKDELLITGMEAIYDELESHFTAPSRAELLSGRFTPAMCESSDYDHVAAHADFYKVMIGPRGVASFVARIRTYLANVNIKWVSAFLLPGETPRLPIEMIAYGIAGLQIGVIAWWLENGMVYSAEEVAQMAYYLCGFGSWASLGFDVPAPERLPIIKAAQG